MGLLEHWDRRNQEIAEFHNETAPPIETMASEAIGTRFWARWVIGWVVFFLFGLALRLAGMGDDTADTVRIMVVLGVGVLALVLAVVQTRRRRMRWKREREART